MKNSDTNLLHTSMKFVCSLTEVSTHRKINLDHALQSWEIQEALDELCEEYKDTFPLHQGDIGNTKLLTMHFGTWDHPQFVQKPYTLHLKHGQWVS